MTVSDAALTATGVTITANEGAPFTALVATFTDANPLATANDFTASIYWGDKTPCSEGEISLSGDNFTVTGSHIYTDEGSHAIIVRIHDVGGSSVSAGSTAQIGDAALSAEGLTVPVIEGTSFSKPVAVFSDANPYGTTEDFTATIDWGDGTTNSGVIVANGSEFYVIGTYMYPDENSEESHGITVSISDIGGSTASAGTTVSVSDAPLTASGMTLPAVEGAPFTNVVAGFTDANPLAATNDFTATIDWGDGSNPSVGLIGINEGGFTVIGSHTYVEEQTYAVNVSIADVGGSQTSAGTTVQVTDAPLTAIGREITPIEDASFVAVVASFLDANPYANTNDFSASIIWGDGITSSGTIVDLGINGFAVMGSHTYTNQGLYFMTVTINDTGGSTATVDSLANTGDALLTGSGTTIAAVQGVAFTNVVANCSDSDASPEQGTEFDCIINWGDGQTTTGTMSEGNEESYSVIGSHTYAQAGSYNILVTVDDPLTMESTSIRSTAVVTAPPAQNVTPQFAIKASRPRLNKRTGLYQQEVTIKNVSKQPVAGPISLVLDNLSSGSGTLSSSSSSVKLMNRDGTILSTGAAPLGSPYRNVSLPKSNVFKGQTARSVVLILQSPSPAITYNTRVLAGPGAR